MEPCLWETIRHLFDQNIDFWDFPMATQWKEAKDLDAKIATHVKTKSAVEGETRPMGKLKAEVMKLLSTLEAGNVMKIKCLEI